MVVGVLALVVVQLVVGHGCCHRVVVNDVGDGGGGWCRRVGGSAYHCAGMDAGWGVNVDALRWHWPGHLSSSSLSC